MFKKLCALFIVTIIAAASSTAVFAGNPEGINSTTSPAVTYTVPNGSGTSTTTGGGGVLQKNDNTSESAISGQASKNPKNSKNALPKTDFDVVFQNALKNEKAVNNGEEIMIITSPDKEKDSTYKKSYILSGKSESDDVVISIAKYNEDTGEYQPMENTDGETSWGIGKKGIFSKEILLTKGTNKIKILSYRESQKEELKLQINCFTIELLDETIAEKVIKKTSEIGASFIKLIGGKSK